MDVLDSGAAKGGRVGGGEVLVEERLLFADGGLNAADFKAGLVEGRREGMEFVGVAAELLGSEHILSHFLINVIEAAAVCVGGGAFVFAFPVQVL